MGYYWQRRRRARGSNAQPIHGVGGRLALLIKMPVSLGKPGTVPPYKLESMFENRWQCSFIKLTMSLKTEVTKCGKEL